MKAHLIRPVDLKLARAKAQAQGLIDSISAWATGSNISSHLELLEGRLGFRHVVADFTQPCQADEWGLLVGECAHNLRSALDNIAFALARRHCDPPPKPSRIAFPIFTDETRFEKEARPTLEQLSAAASGLIKGLQPFNHTGSAVADAPASYALQLLQSLNNADKHRVPSVVVIGQSHTTHEARIEFFREEDRALNVPPDTTTSSGPLHPGAVLLEWRTKHPIASVHHEFEILASVVVETSLGLSPITVMQSLSSYTESVVDQFRSFFLAG